MSKPADLVKAFEHLLAAKEIELRKMAADEAARKKAELVDRSKHKHELDHLWQRLAASERRGAEVSVEHKRVLDRNRVLEADLLIHHQRLRNDRGLKHVEASSVLADLTACSLCLVCPQASPTRSSQPYSGTPAAVALPPATIPSHLGAPKRRLVGVAQAVQPLARRLQPEPRVRQIPRPWWTSSSLWRLGGSLDARMAALAARPARASRPPSEWSSTRQAPQPSPRRALMQPLRAATTRLPRRAGATSCSRACRRWHPAARTHHRSHRRSIPLRAM